MNLLGAIQSRSAPTSGAEERRETPDPVVCRRHAPIAPDARSCCCPAAPVAQVIVTPAGAAAHTETDILLCAHHLRRSAAALRALGAAIYQRGDLLDDIGSTFAADRREIVMAGAGGGS